MLLVLRLPSSLLGKKGLMNEPHKSKNALLDQLGLSDCISLISFKILIMFDGRSLLQRFHGLLEARLIKLVDPSNTIC